jgi:serine protease Do
VPAQGALITAVEPDSPADKAQLQPGAVITQAGDKPIHSAEDLRQVLSNTKSGSVLVLRVAVRGGQGHVLRALRIP